MYKGGTRQATVAGEGTQILKWVELYDTGGT